MARITLKRDFPFPKDFCGAIASKRSVKRSKGEIGAEQLHHPRMSRDETVFGIERFAALDVTAHEGRQKLIDGFIDSVFLYDDRIVLNFNGTREARTLTLEEVKSSGPADKPQPKKRSTKKGASLFFVRFAAHEPAGRYARRQ